MSCFGQEWLPINIIGERPFRGSCMSTHDSSALSKRRERRRRLRRRVQWGGVGMMAAGYVSLAVPPSTEYSVVLVRVALGFVLLAGGLFAALMPILVDALGLGED